jgi:hypothetical protein
LATEGKRGIIHNLPIDVNLIKNCQSAENYEKLDEIKAEKGFLMLFLAHHLT